MQALSELKSKLRQTLDSLDQSAAGLSRTQLLSVLALTAVIAMGGIYSMVRSRPARVDVVDGASVRRKAVESITVHVAGAVASPGLYSLSEGSRVSDAVNKAGGPAPGADLDQLNLAARASDGMKITVPTALATQAAPGSTRSETTPGRVNLNTASTSELEELPGVGPELAGRIVEYRKNKGQFSSVEELDSVDGIGPGRLEDLIELVTI